MARLKQNERNSISDIKPNMELNENSNINCENLLKEKNSQIEILKHLISDNSTDKAEKKKINRKLAKQGQTSGKFILNNAPTVNSASKIGKYLGLDCEMVGVGPDGTQSVLARVSLVNFYGQVVMDDLVKPQERVTDYRTEITGLKPGDLDRAKPFKDIQKQVSVLLKNRIVVGHALKNDFTCLYLSHPASNIRDTSAFKPFKKLLNTKRPSLKRLAKAVLDVQIQTGVHSSVEDARIAMSLFRKHKNEFEALHQKNKKAQDDLAIRQFF